MALCISGFKAYCVEIAYQVRSAITVYRAEPLTAAEN